MRTSCRRRALPMRSTRPPLPLVCPPRPPYPPLPPPEPATREHSAARQLQLPAAIARARALRARAARVRPPARPVAVAVAMAQAALRPVCRRCFECKCGSTGLLLHRRRRRPHCCLYGKRKRYCVVLHQH